MQHSLWPSKTVFFRQSIYSKYLKTSFLLINGVKRSLMPQEKTLSSFCAIHGIYTAFFMHIHIEKLSPGTRVKCKDSMKCLLLNGTEISRNFTCNAVKVKRLLIKENRSTLNVK